MPNLSRQNDPDHNPNFRRLGVPAVPLSPAEQRLSELRREHGNAAGTRIFREEMPAKKVSWL